MSKTIIISEQVGREMYESILAEAFIINNDQTKAICRFLDKSFAPMKQPDVNTSDGDPIEVTVCAWVNGKGETLKTMSRNDMITKLMDRFKHFVKNKESLRKYVTYVYDSWVSGKIDKYTGIGTKNWL